MTSLTLYRPSIAAVAPRRVMYAGAPRRAMYVGALILAFGLVACTTTPDPDDAAAPRPAPVAAPAPTAAPTVAARPAEPPPPPRADPAVLKGLSGDQVTRLIGLPAFRRADDPSALWRYAAAGCVLDLYLRADGAVYRVVHFEFRADPKASRAAPAGALGIDVPACFAAMTAAVRNQGG